MELAAAAVPEDETTTDSRQCVAVWQESAALDPDQTANGHQRGSRWEKRGSCKARTVLYTAAKTNGLTVAFFV